MTYPAGGTVFPPPMYLSRFRTERGCRPRGIARVFVRGKSVVSRTLLHLYCVSSVTRAKELFERATRLAPRDAYLLHQHIAFTNEVEDRGYAISNKDGDDSSSSDLLIAKVSR